MRNMHARRVYLIYQFVHNSLTVDVLNNKYQQSRLCLNPAFKTIQNFVFPFIPPTSLPFIYNYL